MNIIDFIIDFLAKLLDKLPIVLYIALCIVSILLIPKDTVMAVIIFIVALFIVF